MTEIKWKCDDCGTVSSLKELNRDTINGGYPGEPHYTCPVCGSEYVDEVYQCELCGEWFYGDEIYGSMGEMACDKCIEKHKTAEEVVDFASNDLVEVELNGLLAFVFEEDQINELLKRQFMELPKDEQKKYIDDYMSWNKNEFGEFLAR